MNVLLLSRYGRLGASSRLRSYQYLPFLESQGIQVTVSPLLSDAYLENLYGGESRNWRALLGAYAQRLGQLLTSRRYDLVWVEYELLPWLPAWAEQLLDFAGTPTVVDYDDALFHRYDSHPRAPVRMALGRKIDAVMRHASLVIVGNEYLADRARRAGAERVEIVPTVVDRERYRPRQQVEGDRPFTIGWIGSPTSAANLRVAESALAEVCRRPTRLLLVGSGTVLLGGLPVEVRPWSEATEAADIAEMDVGIMPLHDAPWERGKCGYKLIQYMAGGCPVVASPVGVNAEIVEQGRNGFLADSTEEWVRALSLLRDDPARRREMGAAGRRRVESEFCVQATAPRLAALLQSVKARKHVRACRVL